MIFDHYEIRALNTEDLLPYYDMVERNRSRLADFFAGTVARTGSLSDTKNFLAEVEERKAARKYLPFVIIDQLSGNFVGYLDLKNIDWSIPKTEMGCYMDESIAGKGVASKAFGLFCNYCFEEFGFEKLFLRTHPSNTAAIKLAEKNGFEREGMIRCDYKTTSGKLVDVFYYGRLRKPGTL